MTMNPILALQQQRMLLEIEYNCEKDNFQKQALSMGLQRKIKRGDALWPLKYGKSYYNSLNQLALEVYRQADDDVEHNFEYGRPVIFFSLGNNEKTDGKASVNYFKFTGVVNYADGDRIVVTVPDNAPLLELQNAGNFGMQLSFDETSYKMMFEALDRVIRARGNRLAYLRDLFYTPSMKAERFTFGQIRFPDARESGAGLCTK